MMSKISIVVAGLAAAACLSGTAHADGGVDFTPFGPGGVQWSVSQPGFDTPFNYGQRIAQGYDIPFGGALRPGCFVRSPPLFVGHGNGTGQFFAELYSTWEGIVFPRVSLTANVFNLEVEIKAPNGAVSFVRRTVTSSAYQPEVIFFPTPDSVLLWGELDNAASHLSVLQSFDVHTNDEIRVSVCDLSGGSSMQVRKLVLQTVPFDN